jgi:membrane-associated phospholipid phosphatase|tara:strand:- start:2809 stop:3435 length:627 start_codon:yes stop_codon:yes gene_type:complete
MKHNLYFLTPAGLFMMFCGIFLLLFPDKLDAQLAIHHAVYNNTGATVMGLITHWGEAYLIVVIMALGVYHKRYMFSWSFALGGLLSAVFVQVLKRQIFSDSPRPMSVIPYNETFLDIGQSIPMHFAFPSGHTTTAFMLFTLLALNFKRPAIQVVCALAASLVGFSRIYLMVHWITDVLAGAALGMGIALLVYVIFKSLSHKKTVTLGE